MLKGAEGRELEAAGVAYLAILAAVALARGRRVLRLLGSAAIDRGGSSG